MFPGRVKNPTFSFESDSEPGSNVRLAYLTGNSNAVYFFRSSVKAGMKVDSSFLHEKKL